MSRVFLTILFVLLSGCASSYQPEGLTGGYSETQLDENVFKVSFRGNGYTSSEKATELALLRSADLALQRGYSYFIIVNSNEYSSYSSYTTPARIDTSGDASYFGSGSFGGITGNTTTTIHPAKTHIIARPRATNIIVCFKERPKNDTLFVYNAKNIHDSLSKKYK